MEFLEQRSPNYKKTIVDACSCAWFSESSPAEHLWLRCLYESHRRGNWYLERINFPCLLIECITEGELGYETGGERYVCRAGEVMLLPQCRRFRFFSTSAAESKRFAFEVRGSLLPFLAERLSVYHPYVFRASSMTVYRGVFDRMLALLDAKIAGSEPEISGLCWQLLETAMEDMRRLPGRNPHSRLNPLLEHIQRHPEAELSCGVLAKRAGCSVPTLNRMFREVLHESPQNYVLRYRMTLAEHLLQMGELSIKEISSRLGFRNPFYFSRVFREFYGISPAGARKKLIRFSD